MQLELPVFQSAPDDPNVIWFIDFLRSRSEWLTADAIKTFTGWSDRQIRQYAEAADGLIVSGQLGYKHIANATPDEINHAANWLESQANKMAHRAAAIRRHAHQFIH